LFLCRSNQSPGRSTRTCDYAEVTHVAQATIKISPVVVGFGKEFGSTGMMKGILEYGHALDLQALLLPSEEGIGSMRTGMSDVTALD
jgi:hypothetical protein